ncbi:RNA polymerase sigma factor [Spirosoma harenae]
MDDEELVGSDYEQSLLDQRFEALYKRYSNRVYKWCLSMIKDTDLAHDFTQDIFLKVFEKKGAFKQKSSLSTWLYSVTYNYCADQLRLARRLHTTPLEDNAADYIADTVDSQLKEEAWQAISLVLTKLTPEERAILKLKYEDNLSVEEIGARCDLKTSAVKMRLKRSRDKLYQLYIGYVV